ncbi:MAG: autotransporter-associated beta strand repeat-containing protein [Bacteroidales bacterium]|nr:autotransporter-associated beta strand repeat-containing protein [Bacteroidales bacterium]
MKKKILLAMAVALGVGTMPMQAQRVADKLDRGLVAQKAATGVYLNWRILGEEYYDVTYNVYRDGTKLNAEPLSVSNYTDKTGTTSSTYTIKAVVRGVEQDASKSVKPWSTSYKEIKLTHEGIASKLIPNDACCADVNGDGELEILMKFDNDSEAAQSYPKAGPTVDGKVTGEYSIFECLKLDGTRLWWVNCGPNMGDFQNNEQNIVAYDWDCDGKAEAVMRLAEGSTIHYANGKTYTIGANGQNGTSWTNYRAATGGGTNWFVHDGKEFLVYCNGETGEVYQCIDFPLARFEAGETDLNKAWGDGYGHRSSKFFFGAPYLDGRKPSIFLARGIYTRHKMVALDVNPATHKLTQRWKWYNNTNGPWKGQGYHNFAIADVDWDGRDEIVFGSMVIDDNGKGLSTAGLGHGDAQHCGDLNPYVHGQEQFCCNEDEQGFNYRDATTSKIYAQTLHVGKDVGRAMAGNFTEAYPGGLGTAWGTISTVANAEVSGLDATGVNSNMRIYWDGDLVSETFNGEKLNDSPGVIAKYGSWTPIYTCAGSLTNNYTKATPCYQGDILGDWREEIIMRTPDNNIRIYTTPTSTTYRIPTLWADHQYRNAMVWQMCGYNQPPHPSFFLGKTDGITQAPPPLTMNGREEVVNGGSISAAHNGKDVIVCETNNSAVTLQDGAQPHLLVFNVPTWVQGTAPSECSTKDTKITYTTYTCTVAGGGLAGDARLVKQGDGVLTLPKAAFKHTGNTDIWAGVLNFDGTLKESDLWLNRFAELNSNGGEFKSIKADYASIIRPGGEDSKGSLTTGDLNLGFGSRIIVDLFADDVTADQINMTNLSIEAKTTSAWLTAGPTYLSPVIQVVGHLKTGEKTMMPGKYVIGTISGNITGKLDNIVLEGLDTSKKLLYVEDGKLILEIVGMRDAGTVIWSGATNKWDLGESESFKIGDEATIFVSEDNVIFNDDATNKTVNIVGSVIPKTLTVDNTAAYTFQGTGAIDGAAKFVKEGTGKVTMTNNNLYTGGNTLSGGVTVVSALSNAISETGNLGGVTGANKFIMQNGAELNSTAAVETTSPITLKTDEGGVINNAADFKMSASFSGTQLTKKGAGSLFLLASNANLNKLTLAQGGLAIGGGASPKAIEITGNSTIWDDASNTDVPMSIAKGKTCNWNLTYTYYIAYNNKLTGEGTFNIIARNTVSRVRILGDWSNFYGTIKQANTNVWLPLDMSISAPHATLDIAAGCGVANVPGRTWTIGAVTGKGDLTNSGCDFKSSSAVSGTVTYNIGNSDDKNFTFEGTITDRGGANITAFNKVGSCKMTHKGSGSFSGACKVNAGELVLNTTATNPMLGTGVLTVAKDATLSGKGVMANSSVTVAAGGVLRSGVTESNAQGNLQFSGKNVTVNGTMQTYVSTKSSYSKFTNIGTLKLNGTLKVILKEGIDLAEGTELQIISADKITLGTALVLDLDPQYEWDTDRLAEGILVIKGKVDAIRDINASDLEKASIYTLNGVKLNGRPTQRGIYIINGVKTAVR